MEGMTPSPSLPDAVALTGIARAFGPVRANRDVDFRVRTGEIHALVGENGAGKSTLMRILYGLVRPDRGTISVRGEVVENMTPRAAMRLGLGMVHQHFMLVETQTVWENVFLGLLPRRLGPFVDRGTARERVAEVSRAYGLAVDPEARVEELPVGVRQRVEIIKALVRGADILILDEPTAVLTPGEVDALLAILRRLREEGKTVILITHKLDEVTAVSDRVTVMRRGEVVAVRETAETDALELARLVVGREVDRAGPLEERKTGDPVLEVVGVSLPGRGGTRALDGISLTVHAGEILGIAGVDGNGQFELEAVIAGTAAPGTGAVRLGGRDVTRLGARHRFMAGLAHIPQDRVQQGLVAEMTAEENLLLGRHFEERYVHRGLLRRDTIRADAEENLERFDVRPADPQMKAGHLSGGNQQKLVAAREITRRAKLLLAAHPTRGLDVAGAEFIHRCIVAERDRGAGVLLLSAELSEILDLSDRVAVLYRGRLVKTFARPLPPREEIGPWMTGAASEGT
jgi:simple sugar transport system ATP-binding protein